MNRAQATLASGAGFSDTACTFPEAKPERHAMLLFRCSAKQTFSIENLAETVGHAESSAFIRAFKDAWHDAARL